MDISQIGVDLIKRFEGFRNKAYKPVEEEEFWTIAYGHYGPDVKQNQVISKEDGEVLLKKDLKRFVDGVNKLLKVSVNQNQFDALVSFAYNCGLGNLGNSTLLKLVNKKDFKNAANEFDKWVHGANKKVLPGLVTRRKAEKALFLKKIPIKKSVITKPSVPKKQSTPKHIYYTVVKGDTVSKIAAKYKVSIATIKLWNKLDSDYKIMPGQKLRVK
jgi:GH24 family phage-related lysozyme (muramidase)